MFTICKTKNYDIVSLDKPAIGYMVTKAVIQNVTEVHLIAKPCLLSGRHAINNSSHLPFPSSSFCRFQKENMFFLEHMHVKRLF